MKFSDFKNGNSPKPVNPNIGQSSGEDEYEPLVTDADHERDYLARVLISAVVIIVLSCVAVFWRWVRTDVEEEIRKIANGEEKVRLKDLPVKKSNKDSRPDRNSNRPPRNRSNSSVKEKPSVWNRRPVNASTIEKSVNEILAKVEDRGKLPPKGPKLFSSWSDSSDSTEFDLESYSIASQSLDKFVRPFFDATGKPFGVLLEHDKVEIYDFTNKSVHTIEGKVAQGLTGDVILREVVNYSPQLGLIAIHGLTLNREKNIYSSNVTLHNDKNFDLVTTLRGARSACFVNNTHIAGEFVGYKAQAVENDSTPIVIRKSLKTWDIKEGKSRWSHGLQATNQCAFSPGGEFVYVLSTDDKSKEAFLYSIKLRNMNTRSQARFTGISSSKHLQCSLDGQKLISSAEDQFAIWDLKSCELLASYDFKNTYPTDNCRAVFVENGKFVIMGGRQVIHSASGMLVGATSIPLEESFGNSFLSENKLVTLQSAKLAELIPKQRPEKKRIERVRLGVTMLNGSDNKPPPELDLEWCTYAIKTLLQKKLGWEVTDDPKCELLRVAVHESDRLGAEHMAKKVTVQLSLFRDSDSAIWSRSLVAEGKKVSEPANQSILSRTLALVQAFNSRSLVFIEKAKLKDPSALPGSGRYTIQTLPLSGANESPVSFTESTARMLAVDSNDAENKEAENKDEETNSSTVEMPKVDPKPTNNFLPPQFASTDFRKRLKQSSSGEIHFSKSGENSIMIYRAANGNAIARVLKENGKDLPIELPAGKIGFRTRPDSDQFIYIEKGILYAGTFRNKNRLKVVLPQEADSINYEFSRSGQLLAIQLTDNDLRVFKFDELLRAKTLDDVKEIVKIDPQAKAASLGFSGDDKFFFAELFANNQSHKIWNLESPNDPVEVPPNIKRLSKLSLNHDGSILFGSRRLSADESSLGQWTRNDNKSDSTSLEQFDSIVISPNGNLAALKCKNHILVYNTRTMKEISRLAIKNGDETETPLHVKWSHDSRFVGASARNACVGVWEIKPND